MTGTYLQLRFVDDDPASLRGSAYIMLGVHEVGHDCGSAAELETVIKRIHSDLEDIRKQAVRRFDRKWRERTDAAKPIVSV